MLTGMLTLIIISAVSPAKPIIVEFCPNDLSFDLDMFWKYYTNGGSKNDRAYMHIPGATFAIKYGEKNFEEFLILDGKFTECISRIPFIRDSCTKVYHGLYRNSKAEFYGYLQTENGDSFTRIKANTWLRYEYLEETPKQKPYISMRYASMEEIESKMDDIFQDFDDNEPYYTQPTYTISHGEDGHFIEFIEAYSSSLPSDQLEYLPSDESDLYVNVLIGFVSEDGGVLTIAENTVKEFLQHDIETTRTPLEDVLGIRMANIGVLAHQDGQGDLRLFNIDHLDNLLEARFVVIKLLHVSQHLTQWPWGECFGENPPSRMVKGFKVVLEGQVFFKRCGFPIDGNNNEITEDGRKIILDIETRNPFKRFKHLVDGISHFSFQLFLDRDADLYMIAGNNILNIGITGMIQFFY